MSVIKESKTKAQESLRQALDDLEAYFNELEADEDFGMMFDGSTMQEHLTASYHKLEMAVGFFHGAHDRTHWGLR